MANAEDISEKIINEALESYKNRRNVIKIDIPKDHGHDDVVTGVSEGSLKEFLGGNWKPTYRFNSTRKN